MGAGDYYDTLLVNAKTITFRFTLNPESDRA